MRLCYQRRSEGLRTTEWGLGENVIMGEGTVVRGCWWERGYYNRAGAPCEAEFQGKEGRALEELPSVVLLHS